MSSVVQALRPEIFRQPSREEVERRGATRYRTIFRVAQVRRAHDVGLWRVRNISDEGMMLLTWVPVQKGEKLTLMLSDKVTLAATAIWWDGERCGVAFDEPIDCAALLETLGEEQRAPGHRPLRLPVDTRALAYCDRGLHTVRLSDISQHGAGFSHDGCFYPGMATKLHFETGEEYRGVVRWNENGRAGMFLTEPIPSEKLESALRF
ncbi:MAG: PilZ domain-containing protein [Sphingomonadaceae bacterium]|nr:PilZ domain-containing protein [Sphingomonadaceae bacterium]